MGTTFCIIYSGDNIWAVERGTFMEDQDIGDMLLYFMLSEEVILFYWVDITNMRTEEKWESHRSGG